MVKQFCLFQKFTIDGFLMMSDNVLWLCAVADKTHTNFKFKTDYESTKQCYS